METGLQIQRPLSMIASDKDEWHIIKEQAGMLVGTGFLPKAIRTPEQAIAIMMKGKEIGIPPMQAFSQIYIIEGRVALSSELMLALIYKNCKEAKVIFKYLTDKRCVIAANRPGQPPIEFEWTLEDAAKAQLLQKDNWKKYPRAMLRNRCIAEMSRALFPDCISGTVYIPEELEETNYEEKPEPKKAIAAQQKFALEAAKPAHEEELKKAIKIYHELESKILTAGGDPGNLGKVDDTDVESIYRAIEVFQDYLNDHKPPEPEKPRRGRKPREEKEEIKNEQKAEEKINQEINSGNMSENAEVQDFDSSKTEPEWYLGHPGAKAYATIEKAVTNGMLKDHPIVVNKLTVLNKKELNDMDHLSIAQSVREAMNGNHKNLDDLLKTRPNRS